MKNCDRGLENAARGSRPRAAFSSPKSQFFTIRTDPKPANNLFIFFLRYNWVISVGFVYATLSLNRLTRGLQTIRKKSKERTSEQLRYQTKKDVLKNRFISKVLYVTCIKFTS